MSADSKVKYSLRQLVFYYMKLGYAGFDDGGIAIIDATTFKLIGDIKLSGHPESFQIDKSANMIYVNVPDERQVEIINLKKYIISDRWQITEAKSNFPMALDEINHRLFIGCRNPGKLLVKDTQSGKTISSIDIGGDMDDIFYNNDLKHLYLSCGSGSIDILRQSDTDKYIATGSIQSHPGARTSLFIPELNQLFVASPAGLNRIAVLLIYKINK